MNINKLDPKTLGCKDGGQDQGCLTAGLEVKDILPQPMNFDEVHQGTWSWTGALLAGPQCILVEGVPDAA